MVCNDSIVEFKLTQLKKIGSMVVEFQLTVARIEFFLIT